VKISAEKLETEKPYIYTDQTQQQQQQQVSDAVFIVGGGADLFPWNAGP